MKMKKSLVPPFAIVALSMLSGGCGSGSGAEHTISPPRAPANYKVPTTKEEKIAAVNHAMIPDAQKKAEIAKLNAGP